MALCAVLTLDMAGAQTTAHRRALLIGINDYTASRLPRTRPGPSPGRDWPNLSGSVNDVAAIRDMLILVYAFDPRDIVTLTDQSATRNAILQAIEQHLAANVSRNDVLLFYYAGHGSQVRNSLSDEPDKLDESIIPADSRVGAPDIRDKELRLAFNRILDRGARLTVVLDNCHSGSGARGLSTGARPRGVAVDLRDVHDGSNNGPRPENRGALVLSASEDDDDAWETRDAQGNMHGAFTWALLRAMRSASAGEAAIDTFLRARARLRAETPFQDPVVAGNSEARLTPLFGDRRDRRGDRMVVAIEKVRSDGTVVLQGGWANGLSIGCELLEASGRTNIRLAVTALEGLGKSEARIETSGRTMPQAIQSGTLLQVVTWAASPLRQLRVATPSVSNSIKHITGLARALAAEATRRGVHWIADPIEKTPAYVLRRAQDDWELIGPDSAIEHLQSDASAVGAVAKLARGTSLFVQLPAPNVLVDGIDIGPGTRHESIELANRQDDADYILVGRYSSRRLEYAWMRPGVRRGDKRKTGLPLRTAWNTERGHEDSLRDSGLSLREQILRLRKIYAWSALDSPYEGHWPYRLALRRLRDGDESRDSVIGDDAYELTLRASPPTFGAPVAPRYVYVFVIDSYGQSTLLFPPSGSVENRFPLPAAAGQSPYPPTEIPLGSSANFEIAPPYGVDTYFLLTTDEPLPDPWILEWDGVRGAPPRTLTQLDQLLALTSSGRRPATLVTPNNWSLQRAVYESVAPRSHTAQHPTKRRKAVS
jgi:hypothetical protein